MKKFKGIIEKYRDAGVTQDNIEYAIISIKEDVSRGQIYASLTSGYRTMDPRIANLMLDDLYLVHGGENKSGNRFSFYFGILLLVIGVSFTIYIIITYPDSRYPLGFPRIVGIIAGATLLGGISCLYDSIKGRSKRPAKSHGKTSGGGGKVVRLK